MACSSVTRSMSKALSRPKAVPYHRSMPCRKISSHTGVAARQYLIQVPDLPNSQENRFQTKQTHIKECTPLMESGKLSYFGVTLSDHPQNGETPKINGSIMVLEAEDVKAVKDFLERDAYTRAGVWDIGKAQIWPFKRG